MHPFSVSSLNDANAVIVDPGSYHTSVRPRRFREGQGWTLYGGPVRPSEWPLGPRQRGVCSRAAPAAALTPPHLCRLYVYEAESPRREAASLVRGHRVPSISVSYSRTTADHHPGTQPQAHQAIRWEEEAVSIAVCLAKFCGLCLECLLIETGRNLRSTRARISSAARSFLQ
jgi:hypothetical protein